MTIRQVKIYVNISCVKWEQVSRLSGLTSQIVDLKVGLTSTTLQLLYHDGSLLLALLESHESGG